MKFFRINLRKLAYKTIVVGKGPATIKSGLNLIIFMTVKCLKGKFIEWSWLEI